ncbi:MAG: EF-hand domain-containing protein [Gemmataceae bacterium]|nr:EF-hand domain-containing protein [Gemmataceae bacterium]
MRSTILLAGFAATLLAGGPAFAQQAAKSPLDAGFDKWDTNKDGFLDAGELARAFRGPAAKVIDHKAGGQPDAHPDHQFLTRWDADKDGKVSRAEFDKYEQKTITDLRAAANRPANYTPTRRTGNRAPYSHRGYTARGRGYGSSNPYAAMLRYQQRSLAQQRQFYSAQRRYMTYSPNSRSGYRGAMTHGYGRRR